MQQGGKLEVGRHDTGDQLKYIKAVIDLALESEEYGAELTTFLKDRLDN